MSQDYYEAPLCFFASDSSFRGCLMRDDGKYDFAHMIPAQRLRIAKDDDQDPRLVVLACRRHHHAFDMKMIQLREDQYSDPVKQFAKENDWQFMDERTGWVKTSTR